MKTYAALGCAIVLLIAPAFLIGVAVAALILLRLIGG